MKARVVLNGKMADEILIVNRLKQGDILAPNTILDILFYDADMHFSIVRAYSFGIQNNRKGFRRFNFKSKSFYTLIREFLHADGFDFLVHSVNDMQHIVGLFAASCTAFGLKISCTKRKVMFTLITGEPN